MNNAAVPVRVVVSAWLASYFAAFVIAAVVVGASGYANVDASDQPFWVAGASTLALWVPMLFALYWVSQKTGSGDFRSDFAVRWQPSDLVGLPLGVIAQLILVPIVTWPFQQIWPESFNADKVEQRARDLYNSANGGWIVVLVVVVVIGAPLIEEVVYRGFIQRSLAVHMGQIAAMVTTAAWFTMVHLQPIEFPGLLCFALILGFCTMRTNRIGMSVMAHVAFNATGLLLVAVW